MTKAGEQVAACHDRRHHEFACPLRTYTVGNATSRIRPIISGWWWQLADAEKQRWRPARSTCRSQPNSPKTSTSQVSRPRPAWCSNITESAGKVRQVRETRRIAYLEN